MASNRSTSVKQSDTWIDRNISAQVNNKSGTTDLIPDDSIWANDTLELVDKIRECENDLSVVITTDNVSLNENAVEDVITLLPGD